MPHQGLAHMARAQGLRVAQLSHQEAGAGPPTSQGCCQSTVRGSYPRPRAAPCCGAVGTETGVGVMAGKRLARRDGQVRWAVASGPFQGDEGTEASKQPPTAVLTDNVHSRWPEHLAGVSEAQPACERGHGARAASLMLRTSWQDHESFTQQ